MDKIAKPTSSAELLTPEQEYDILLRKLPSRAPIYLPTDKLSLEQKIAGVKHVVRIYKEDLDKVYRPRLRALREQYRDRKRCFLIGNGPSLNETDLSVLADEVTFAVNGFFLKAGELDWTPTFYCVEDHLVAEDRAKWINQLKGPIKFFPAYLGYMFPAAEDTVFYNHRPRKSYPHGFDFSLEADKITYTGCTVTFSLMQLAAYLGFEDIYLIGVDASYSIPIDAQSGDTYGVGVLDMKSDDPNHFDPNYFGKGFRWHDPQVEKMIEAYSEAHKALKGTGQTIYNATVGGALEVFERRSFHAIFPNARSPREIQQINEAKRVKNRPRLLVLDMTPIGHGTATGEIKANILADWPENNLLQVARHNKDELCIVSCEDGTHRKTVAPAEQIMAQLHTFDPDVVLYRPLPDSPELHAFSMKCIRTLQRPLMSWIMDDWMLRSAAEKPDTWHRIAADLREVLDCSHVRLAISPAMSESLMSRFGLEFIPLANGVDPTDWTSLAPRAIDRDTFIVRYAGGVAQDMCRVSIYRIAEAVEQIAASGRQIRFEISTQPWWKRQIEDYLARYKHTVLQLADKTISEYRAWLAQSDLNVIAYNFDETSLRYTRTSFGNKTPELMAANVPILVHGPRGTATIDYLASKDCTVLVDTESVEQIIAVISELMEAHDRGTTLGARARDIAFAEKNIHDIRRTFHALAGEAAASRYPGAEKENRPAVGAATLRAAPRGAPQVCLNIPHQAAMGTANDGNDQGVTMLGLTGQLLVGARGEISTLLRDLRDLLARGAGTETELRHAAAVIAFAEKRGKAAIARKQRKTS